MTEAFAPAANISVGSICQNQSKEYARTTVLRPYRLSLDDDVVGIGASYAGDLGAGATAIGIHGKGWLSLVAREP